MAMMRDLMTRDPACCTQQDSITEAARLMLEADCGAIPVVESMEDRRLVGIITDRDIVCRVVARELDPAGTRVHQAMSEQVATLPAEATIEQCVRLMADRMVRRVPIVDDRGRVVGMVAQADLARASSREPQLEDELAEVVEEISEPTRTARCD